MGVKMVGINDNLDQILETGEDSDEISSDDFCELANKFVNQDMYDEAISIYETAIKLFPDSLALKINLGRVRDKKKKSESEHKSKVRDEILREQEESDRLCNKYFGLASAYLDKNKTEKAIELLELAKYENPNFYLIHKNLAEIYKKQGDLTKAITELETSKDLNPFDRETSTLLGRLYSENGDYEEALENYIRAFLLSTLSSESGKAKIQKKMKHLFDKLEIEGKEARQNYIKERMNQFNALVDELDEKRKEFMESTSFSRISSILSGTKAYRESKDKKLESALELKDMRIFKDLTDDELYRIARIAQKKEYPAQEVLCKAGENTGELLVLEKGDIEIFKNTPVGKQNLGKLREGDLLGELNYIDRGKHSATAKTLEQSRVWSLNNDELRDIFEMEKETAVHFFRHFWKSISDKIRSTNELMNEFFTEEMKSGKAKKEVEKELAEATDTQIDRGDKIEVLEDSGLSSKELKLLGSFGNEMRFEAGKMIFREGDEGNALYIILDGEVIISKDIPGVGEEALAVLERGDFFGEMALVDSSTRSADAKVHPESGAAVLKIEKSLLEEILSLEVESAYQFLSILCRILSLRLREITEKLIRWKIMSGNF